MSYNRLSGNFPHSLTSLTNHLGVAVTIVLSHNSLTGELPENIFHIFLLSKLQLSYNQFSGPLPDFSRASQLTQVHSDVGSEHGYQTDQFLSHSQLLVDHNQFTGNISDLGDISPLSLLDISHNQFSGRLPDSVIVRSPLLVYIDIKGNSSLV